MKLFGNMTTPELIEEARELLAKAKERFTPKMTLGLFSGGNDSTAALWVVKDQIDAAVHIVTGIGIMDKGRTALDHVRACCESWKVPLIVLETKPEVYRHIVLRPDKPNGGFPGRHDITYHLLKSERLAELQRDMSKRGERLLFVSGVRQNESKRRARGVARKAIDEPRGRLKRCAWSNPIIGFTKAHLFSLREQAGLPQCEGSALIHKSGECLCAAFPQPPGMLKEIEFWFPETGRYIRELEREAAKAGKLYCEWGKGVSKGKAKPVGPLCQGCELFKDSVTAPAGAP